MNINKLYYELDTSGTLEANRISKEEHTITPTLAGEVRYVIPNSAPYYVFNAELYLINENTEERTLLEKYGDWAPILEIVVVTDTIHIQVCTGIAILDSNISGRLSFDYNTLGGDFTVDSEAVLSAIANYLGNPLVVTYEDILGKPTVFPPDTHYLDANNVEGMDKLILAYDNHTEAVKDATELYFNVLYDHIKDISLHGGATLENALKYLYGSRYASSTDITNGYATNAILTASNIQELSNKINKLTKEELNQLSEEIDAINKNISNWKNYPTPTLTTDYVSSNNKMYTLVSDVYKILSLSVASSTEASNTKNSTSFITPERLWGVLSNFIRTENISQLATDASQSKVPSSFLFNSLYKTLTTFKETADPIIEHVNLINTGLSEENGWSRLGDGSIIQWGIVKLTAKPIETNITITMPVTFPNVCLSAGATRMAESKGITSTNNDGGILLCSYSASQLVFNYALFTNDNANVRGFTWYAIGR